MDLSNEVKRIDAIKDVLAERQRQIEAEGWTSEHDDLHSGGDLAMAGACYACAAATWVGTRHQIPEADYPKLAQHGFRWPWHAKWWKPKTPRRDLVRAAALPIAEIERLDRVEMKSPNAALTRGAEEIEKTRGAYSRRVESTVIHGDLK